MLVLLFCFKAKEMEKTVTKLLLNQPEELNSAIILLVERYRPEEIFCFNTIGLYGTTSGCFRVCRNQKTMHYFLLMVTKEVTRKETEVQDYINTHISGIKITIIVHGKSSVEQAINQGNSFFIDIYMKGESFYHAIDGLSTHQCPNLNQRKQALKRQDCFLDHYDTAAGFLFAAESCADRAYYNNALFMLHQTLEHACIALIRLFINYRPATHSLTKSLNLCLCFSDEPDGFFPRRTTEEKRLFELLSSGYSDARYNNKFKAVENDVSILRFQLRDFLTLTRELGYAKIDLLKLKAGITL
jgi:HEPN domain-containing protein